jgi:hypothetical protein
VGQVANLRPIDHRPVFLADNRGVKTLLAASILAGAGICLAQSSSTVSLSNGAQISVTAKIGQPTGEQSVKIQLAPASGNSIYRIFRDQNDLAVFAYELAVDRSDDGTEFLVTAKPVENEFAARFPGADGGKPVPTLSSEQKLASMRSGTRSDIGLFTLEGMGIKVVDTVQVRLNQGGSTSLDSPVANQQERLRFSSFRVSIDRTPVAGAIGSASVSGRYLMFYIPGRGGYFFSLDNPAGRTFTKAGSIDRNRLTFVLDNEIYDCATDAPILSGVGGGEVWVYRDASYRPEGNWTRDLAAGGSSSGEAGFFTASSDSLNWWLP